MLKDCYTDHATVYLGRSAGKEIYQRIKDAKTSIKIITPYISAEFIDLLIDKARCSLDVRLIVSSDIGTESEKHTSLRKLISQTRHTNQQLKIKRSRILKLVAFSFFISLILIAVGLYFKYLEVLYLLISFPIMYLIRRYYLKLKIYSYSYASELSLSIPVSPYTFEFDDRYTLVHAKMFVIDGQVAYLGSLNFTKAGFWKNYESRIKLTQQELISKLESEFDYLYKNQNTSYVDLSKLGSALYKEPPN